MRITKNLQNSLNHKKFGEIIKENKKSKIPVSKASNTGEYPFYNSSSKLNMSHNEHLLEGTKIVLSTGGRGPSLHLTNGKFAHSTDTYVVESNDPEILTPFLYYYLSNNMNMLDRCFLGIDLRHLNKNILKKENIFYPDVKIQKDIISLLNSHNSYLQSIQTLISKMEQRNQYYLHGLTSGELAIKDGITFENDENTNVVVLNGKTKEVPASFDEFKLGDIIQEENKSKLAVKDAIEGEYPFFNCSETLSMTHNDYLVDGNYIIMSTGGKPSIHYYEGKMAYSSDSYVISATDNVNSRYLAFLLKANMKRIERCFLGSGLKHLNKKIFKREVYHLPDLDKQKEVADFLSKNEDEVNLVRELYSKEKQVFQWLCEKLVSGEYRINE